MFRAVLVRELSVGLRRGSERWKGSGRRRTEPLFVVAVHGGKLITRVETTRKLKRHLTPAFENVGLTQAIYLTLWNVTRY